jgi:hypothetical protein
MRITVFLTSILSIAVIFLVNCSRSNTHVVTVPFQLDHNRMRVNAEIQKPDSSWRNVLLWVDTGNPEFFVSESLAVNLGIDLPDALTKSKINAIELTKPANIRMGGMALNFEGINTKVMFRSKWLFSTMHIDANLPSTVLQKYQVVFDYPQKKLTLAESGSIKHIGEHCAAIVNQNTGIVQINAEIYGDSLSFALDNGASYSFTSEAVLDKILTHQGDCPKMKGALGCANIWGWWPGEEAWNIIRVPEIKWGSVTFSEVGLVALPDSFPLAIWYSRKSARPVDGILGPNVFKSCRVEIDYPGSAVYFNKGPESDFHDMDMVGLTLRPEMDGNYSIIGVAEKDGIPAVEGIESGDILVKVDDLTVKNSTMGTVIDALRGKPGDTHQLILQREGKQFEVVGTVKRFL